MSVRMKSRRSPPRMLTRCSPGLVSTSPERSNNFEVSQILFEMEVELIYERMKQKWALNVKFECHMESVNVWSLEKLMECESDVML